jgi:hypothetical protein
LSRYRVITFTRVIKVINLSRYRVITFTRVIKVIRVIRVVKDFKVI